MYVPVLVLVLHFTWCSPFNPILWVLQINPISVSMTSSCVGCNSPNLLGYIAID